MAKEKSALSTTFGKAIAHVEDAAMHVCQYVATTTEAFSTLNICRAKKFFPVLLGASRTKQDVRPHLA